MSDPVGTVTAEPHVDETPDGAAPGEPPVSPPDPPTPIPRLAGRRRDRSIRGFIRRSGGVGLRRRILLIFTLGSLTLSAFLAFTTYGLVRSNLIEQRYAVSRQAA